MSYVCGKNYVLKKSSLCEVSLLQNFTVFRDMKNSSVVKQDACGFMKCKLVCFWIRAESFTEAQILKLHVHTCRQSALRVCRWIWRFVDNQNLGKEESRKITNHQS